MKLLHTRYSPQSRGNSNGRFKEACQGNLRKMDLNARIKHIANDVLILISVSDPHLYITDEENKTCSISHISLVVSTLLGRMCILCELSMISNQCNVKIKSDKLIRKK